MQKGTNAFIFHSSVVSRLTGRDDLHYVKYPQYSPDFGRLRLLPIIDNAGHRLIAIIGDIGGGAAWGIMALLTSVYSKAWAAVAMAFAFVLL
ncbi:uncharacterized protein GLRG_05998 [Colletotrichum graminicola M1.001]|uniref:Uncharacterized protein n=1 Tax=Colletotrichum graminicola (strain M1.001 / M2 / FGSC 10212) TaxID=645133 RepID=E3QJ16_COLGM|nr:uncharacterized protein GLRG_05998 [Colletotrichum graminicola M1.001]EFQ30854.1 hypothetical protein GLRG_05998 [Colletotrichum graminicola M1.001]